MVQLNLTNLTKELLAITNWGAKSNGHPQQNTI